LDSQPPTAQEKKNNSHNFVYKINAAFLVLVIIVNFNRFLNNVKFEILIIAKQHILCIHSDFNVTRNSELDFFRLNVGTDNRQLSCVELRFILS